MEEKHSTAGVLEAQKIAKNSYCFLSIAGKELSSDEVVIKLINNAINDGTRDTKKECYNGILQLIGEDRVNQSEELKGALSRLKASIDTYGSNEVSTEQGNSSKIDTNRLEACFSYQFKKNAGIDSLVNLFNDCYGAIWYAKIAYQIYISPHFLNKPRLFSQWYRTFCEIVGCEYCEGYKPCKLKLSPNEEPMFTFLKIK